MALKPGTRLGPYEILEPIGSGGMGEVYRGRDERLGREVAVKILPASFAEDPERLRRFEQEARAAGQLNHPNIVAVFDVGTHEGVPYVVQELLEGETLRERLEGGALPVRKAVDLARQIALGLAPAHQKGIVHRDLKPENLFVTRDGRIKILDFGLAKLSHAAEPGPEGAEDATQAPTRVQTGAGVILGSVGYMSPEQVRGQAADPRSDLFSFGAVLHEMITGQRAFSRDSTVETMSAILQADPPAASQLSPDVPAGLERIVQRCLEKSPDERFQSASDLAFQLEALSTLSGSMTGVAPGAAAVPRRSRTGLLAAVVVSVAALVAAFLAGRAVRPTTEPATYAQLTYRQGTIFSARFTPDGTTVIYGAGWEGAPTELFSTRPGNPGSRALGVTDAEILSISASGEMAILLHPAFTQGWRRTGTLARLPLAGGVPREVLESVQDAVWAPDGEGLAVVRFHGSRYRLEYPVGRVLFETDGWVDSPRFSRDGQRIAFLDHPSAGGDNRGRVQVVDLDGEARPLTGFYSSSAGLAWAPDDAEVWFTAGKSGNVRALYAVDLSGRERVVDAAPADLTLQDVGPQGQVLVARNTARRGMAGRGPDATAERDLSFLDWGRPSALSADGRWFLFEEQGQGGGPEYSVYLGRTDGSPPVRLGKGYSCSLSADRQWALTMSVAEPRQVVALPTAAGEPRTIDVPGLRVGYINWFPDGRRLLVQGNEPDRPLRYYVYDPEGGGAPRPITPEGVSFGGSVSSDGTWLAALGPDDRLVLYPVAGGEPVPVAGALPGEIVAGFADDGRAVFVGQRAGLPLRIYRLDLDTGARDLWRTLAPSEGAGLLDAAYVSMTGSADAYVYSYRRILSTLYLVENLG